MPTRIVLNTNPVPSQLSPRRTNQYPPVHLTPVVRRVGGEGPSNDEGKPWSFADGNDTRVVPDNDNHQDDDDDNNNKGRPADLESNNVSADGGGPNLRKRSPNSPIGNNKNDDKNASTNNNNYTNSANNNNTNSRNNNNKTVSFVAPSSRRTSGFRSSILRELSVRQDAPSMAPTAFTASYYLSPDDVPGMGGERYHRSVSGTDIRASPRFLGYLFSAISGSVLLVSLVQFFEKEVLHAAAKDTFFVNNTALPDNASDRYFATASGDLIYQWKMWGAIYAAASLVGLCILIMLVHYDTIFLPKLWVAIFRDGSLAERNLILFLLLAWTAAVHICTSTLAVGGLQANVYFTSWIAFGSIALTLGVWRESAGLPTLVDLMNQHKRETTYNWFWIMIFSIVFAGAATDLYYNRNEVEERYEGEVGNLQNNQWLWVMSVFWFEVFNCIIAIIINDLSTEHRKLPCTCTRSSERYRCVFGWRQMEGIIMIAWIGVKFWVIWDFTGVDGVINGLSNAYFGIWGSFFNSVFALGTWLRENQDMEYIVRDEPNENNEVARD
ncbi:hypothetical protein ACA910_004209 [Epithemia clementina (nom. ined.)]